MPPPIQVKIDKLGVLPDDGDGPVVLAFETTKGQTVVAEMSPRLAQILVMETLQRLSAMPVHPLHPRSDRTYQGPQPHQLALLGTGAEMGILLASFGPAEVPLALSRPQMQALHGMLSTAIALLGPPAGSA